MKVPDMEFDQALFACPACGQQIKASCTVDVALDRPEVNLETRCIEFASSGTLTRFTINHRCPGRPAVVEAARSDL